MTHDVEDAVGIEIAPEYVRTHAGALDHGGTMPATFITGDALATLATLPDASHDAMLCDPPYGIAFMGKEWDTFKAGDIAMRRNPQMNAVNTGTSKQGGRQRAGVDYQKRQARDARAYQEWVTAWATEALRVLKPGAFALVACGTRTQHRMASGLEDAGFEVRDVIAWLYGSGFPKSHDVSKAIDKAAGAERQVLGVRPNHRPNAPQNQPGADATAWQDRSAGTVTAPATPDAERWQGYGTALKPAMELWTLVRKPLDGTVAANALKHGVGGLNIDGCRVATDDPPQPFGTPTKSVGGLMNKTGDLREKPYEAHTAGRWPANVIHDGSDEVLDLFPDTTSVGHAPSARGRGGLGTSGHAGQADLPEAHFDTGSAARFFYAAKASRAEREAGLDHRDAAPIVGRDQGQDALNRPHKARTSPTRNPHPTVKPLALTTYLATLLLPPARADGMPRRIIVPFAGVGSEMIGASRAGWEDAVGIEIDPEYVRIAEARIRHWTSVGPLFDDA